MCPITIKIYFQLFILVNPLSPAASPRLPPSAARLHRRAAVQSKQPYNIPLLQSSVLLGLVVMRIRIHIIITHSPRCAAEGILASTQLERTEQNGHKIAGDYKNTTCHTPLPFPRLCSVNCVQLFAALAGERTCVYKYSCACRQQAGRQQQQDHQIVFVANTNEHTPAHLPSHLGQSVRH